MVLIAKRMLFMPYTHEHRGVLIVPFHHAVVKHIDLRLVELVRHGFVTCLFHLPHMEEYIFIMYLPVFMPKGGKDFIKVMARHVFVQKNRDSSMHHLRFNLPPVTPFRYPNPTRHIQPTINQPHELTRV